MSRTFGFILEKKNENNWINFSLDLSESNLSDYFHDLEYVGYKSSISAYAANSSTFLYYLVSAREPDKDENITNSKEFLSFPKRFNIPTDVSKTTRDEIEKMADPDYGPCGYFLLEELENFDLRKFKNGPFQKDIIALERFTSELKRIGKTNEIRIIFWNS